MHGRGQRQRPAQSNNRSQPRLVDVHQALGLSRIQPKTFHTNGEMATIALDLMGHELRAKGKITSLNHVSSAAHPGADMETATYIQGSQIGWRLNANQRCKWNSRSS